MDDKDRELVSQVLHAAGTAGQEGFAAMVKYQWADGMTDVIASSFAIFVFLIFIVVIFFIKIDDDEDRIMLRLFVAVPSAILILVVVSAGLMGGVTKMIAPEGAAIHSVLHR